MIRCVIIEDQPPAQRVLQKFILDSENIELIGTFADVLSAINCIKTEQINLIFLDIHLPKISGMDFLKIKPSDAHVILTTAFSEYALESYEYNVVDYLLKPFSYERFKQAILKVPEYNLSKKESSLISEDAIFIKSGYEHIKIAVNTIRFIQSDSDYTEILTTNKKYLSQEPLRHWQSTLNQTQFTRIHKSYIVNLSLIIKVTSNRVWLDEKTSFPIGRAYKDDFKKRLSL